MVEHGQAALPRRRLLGLLGAAGAIGLVGCGGEPEKTGQSAPAPGGALGANFNGDPSVVTFPELQAIESSWLRGFYLMRDAERGDPARQPVITTMRTAADRGYGTVLSLKFQYGDQPVPQPGSPELAAEFARLDKVLPVVMGRTDILAIGNEPFFETRKEDQNDKLNAFYEAVAKHVIEYRDNTNSKTRLFMGALNRLDEPEHRTAATDRWLHFVRDTPALEGVDIHPHVKDPADTGKYLDYVLSRMRPEQKFLATEFSLVLFWKTKLTEPVAPEFARRYGFPAGTPVWKVVRAATENPFPQQQWNDFLSTSPWYENHKHFLREQMRRFRETGRLAVATYGIAQDDAMVRDFGPDSTPWLFNSLFASKTVRPGTDGLPGRGYGWIEDFRALQRDTDKRPVR